MEQIRTGREIILLITRIVSDLDRGYRVIVRPNTVCLNVRRLKTRLKTRLKIATSE